MEKKKLKELKTLLQEYFGISNRKPTKTKKPIPEKAATQPEIDGEQGLLGERIGLFLWCVFFAGQGSRSSSMGCAEKFDTAPDAGKPGHENTPCACSYRHLHLSDLALIHER